MLKAALDMKIDYAHTEPGTNSRQIPAIFWFSDWTFGRFVTIDQLRKIVVK